MIQTSQRDPATAVYRATLPAGDYWLHRIEAGQTLRITDLEGNQAADTLFYNADDTAERYSVTDTLRGQRNVFLSTGSVLRSNEDRPMLEIVADTCGRHDTLGVPAPPRATPCATTWKNATCTPAATVGCWRWRNTRNTT